MAALRDSGRDPFSILVVDDGSPDGTGLLADRLGEDYPQVQVLHRAAKAGLGAAYVAGFTVALGHGASHVVQMDADLSHDPADVPDMLDATAHADVIIGSRYVAGGSTPDWGLKRRLLSRAGSFYARRLLDLPIRDLTGGFKCWSRRSLLGVGLGDVDAAGYVFQIEMTSSRTAPAARARCPQASCARRCCACRSCACAASSPRRTTR
jgi:dolichol-phosphate mannosyltransferase